MKLPLVSFLYLLDIKSQFSGLKAGKRLKNGTPVSYAETEIVKKRKSLQDDGVLLEEGSKPEVYTEEHEKRLGNTEKNWILFVDGYGKDGKRIYDQAENSWLSDSVLQMQHGPRAVLWRLFVYEFKVAVVHALETEMGMNLNQGGVRTDGKKWRCSKDVVRDQKYCEQHMHRGAEKRVAEHHCQ
ncbi:hypothetical protein SO802_010719 [Lithocarpus litseifolius]|uniref:Growth-regulating factor n=1 Tax=Lithocarpus litseifolius TaxID=425828 RepID=A0AAW2DEZ7_9ROSI